MLKPEFEYWLMRGYRGERTESNSLPGKMDNIQGFDSVLASKLNQLIYAS